MSIMSCSKIAAELCEKENLLEFLYHLENVCPLKNYFEEWKKTKATISHEEKDPRESALKELFCDIGHKNVMIRHHYTLPSRRSGTIYEKQTHAEKNCGSPNKSVPPPPELWFRSLGGSVDYVNGTLHFPMRMPAIGEDFCSYTIRRHKVSAAHLLFIAAQLEFDRRHHNPPIFCDSSISYVADILSEQKSLDSKQYTPRKISVAQTKELLHAWVLVYVYQKKEYLPVLEYYLYAGYVVSITKKCGGNHEK